MYQDSEEILQGTIRKISFQNTENGYTVLTLHRDDGEDSCVVGVVPMAAVGERLLVTGRWTVHATYGKQFEAEFLERLMPESEEDILAFLSSRAIRGIGPRTAQRIVDAFGRMSLDVLEREPARLAQIPGISREKAETIGKLYKRQIAIRRLIEYLSAHGLAPEYAMPLFRIFGVSAMEALDENPYILAEPDFGAEFAKVDTFALEIGMSGEDMRRVSAGILFELSHNTLNGHAFLPADKLVAATVQLLNLGEERVVNALESLVEEGRVITDKISGITAVYLPELYEAESYLTERFLSMTAMPPVKVKNAGRYLDLIEENCGIVFADAQKEAILLAAESRVMILTGGPGTGKTTTLKGILELFDLLGKKTLLSAPTGRAAKRLTELTGRDASTIHRLLEVQYSESTGKPIFLKDESDPLDADVMVVDETSMVDILLMAALMHALPRNCSLILVGDPDQLPSVGPGNLFSNLIRSGAIPIISLKEIFRQAKESLIIMNAHAVNRGEMPALNVRDRDFFFMRETDPQKAVELISDLCKRRLPEKMDIPPEEIQVLCPSKKYETGTRNLNLALQAALNPSGNGKKEKIFRDFTFREGDRVMQIRNNYDIMWKKENSSEVGTGIFNGDVGLIRSINPEQEILVVAFDDRIVNYSYDLLSELELAYAMTVHKSQGSEYRAVILSALQGSSLLLTRNVLYTAITRAKDLLIIVGDERAVEYMVNNNLRSRRYSGLKIRMGQER